MELIDPISKCTSIINEENLKQILDDKIAMKTIRYEAGTIFRKTPINGSLELIRDNCKTTKQEIFLSQQIWNPFSRILRNVSAHHMS